MRNLSYCARVKCGEGEASSAASDKHRSLERSKTFARGVGEANDRRKGSSNMGVVSAFGNGRDDATGGCGFRLLLSTDELCEFIDPPNGVVAITHQVPTMVKLVWRHHPQSVLLVKKPRDPDITAALVKVVEILKSLGVVNIFVEVPVYDELRDAGSSVLEDILPFENKPAVPTHARSSSVGVSERRRRRTSSEPRDGATKIVIDFIVSLGEMVLLFGCPIYFLKVYRLS